MNRAPKRFKIVFEKPAIKKKSNLKKFTKQQLKDKACLGEELYKLLSDPRFDDSRIE
jgi:hypothetical protein